MGHLVLVDIKNSSRYEPTKLWTVWNQAVTKINKKFKLQVPMIITLGDEAQMVCQNKAQAKEVVKYLNQILSPIKVRAVITRFYKKTNHFNTLKKINKVMLKQPVNPLISKAFVRAHRELSKKSKKMIILL